MATNNVPGAVGATDPASAQKDRIRDVFDSAEQANLDAWNEAVRRRWATYWARHARGLRAPFPNTGGWRCPVWRRYWFLSVRVGDRWKNLPQSSRGAARRALKRAQRRGLEAKLWSLQQGPDRRIC